MTLPTPDGGASRRDFLTTSAALAGSLAVLPGLTPAVHAAGSDTLKIGLIGCGNRGTGAATQALRADPNVKLVALGDVFRDKVDAALKIFKNDDELGKKVDVKPENCFDGFDAYKGVIAASDVVLLTTPPGFRPLHLAAAVEAGKHIFCEKPMAVDAPGVRKVMETVRKAREKSLALVAGFCWRYHNGMRETFQRVHAGEIGDLVALQCSYNTDALWHRSLKEKEAKGWSDMEWQLRNWLYFTWLSGDHIVEQACHSLDKMAWAMKDEPPVRATGLGGRQTRTAPDFGNIFDHHAVVYEYKGGVRMYHTCRQQIGCDKEVADYLMGTKGVCRINASTGAAAITGAKPWQLRRKPGARDDMYQNEHDELFASIRAGKPINDGERMARSTLMAIMGRMATYTGKVITWEMALNSKEDLTPPKYELGPLPVAPVAMPGKTPFI